MSTTHHEITPADIRDLDDDTLHHLLTRCSDRGLCATASVCKRMHRVSQQPAMWQQRLAHHFPALAGRGSWRDARMLYCQLVRKHAPPPTEPEDVLVLVHVTKRDQMIYQSALPLDSLPDSKEIAVAGEHEYVTPLPRASDTIHAQLLNDPDLQVSMTLVRKDGKVVKVQMDRGGQYDGPSWDRDGFSTSRLAYPEYTGRLHPQGEPRRWAEANAAKEFEGKWPRGDSTVELTVKLLLRQRHKSEGWDIADDDSEHENPPYLGLQLECMEEESWEISDDGEPVSMMGSGANFTCPLCDHGCDRDDCDQDDSAHGMVPVDCKGGISGICTHFLSSVLHWE